MSEQGPGGPVQYMGHSDLGSLHLPSPTLGMLVTFSGLQCPVWKNRDSSTYCRRKMRIYPKTFHEN